MTPFNIGNLQRWAYKLSIDGTDLPCCKLSFMDAYQISAGIIRTVQNARLDGKISILDARGTHHNRPHRISAELKEMIRQHIRRFPTYESHYGRNNNEARYLNPELTVERMFKLFKEENMQIPNIEKKEWLYRSIFKSTGLRIGCPRVDTCKTCDLLHVKLRGAGTEAERLEITQEQDEHHRNAEAAQCAMSKDIELSKNDPSVICKVVDLQQVLLGLGQCIVSKNCPLLKYN